jgi:hypothetical protein
MSTIERFARLDAEAAGTAWEQMTPDEQREMIEMEEKA